MLSRVNRTRERSLDAAVEAVREVGLSELTTRSIARRSGLTQPAIYRHFSGVDELIRETLGRVRELFVARLEGSVGDGGAKEELMRVLEVFRDFAIEEPLLYDALFLQIGDQTPLPVSKGSPGGQNIFAHLVERVAECSRQGIIREDRPVASALTLIAHAQGLILLYRQGRFGSKERFAEAYTKSIEDHLRGLRPSSQA